MSKPSRRAGRPAGVDATGRTPDRRSSGPSGTPRAGRRERVRTYDRPSPLERYRTPLLAVVAVLAIALIGGFVFVSASQPAYACTTTWEPEPTPSPAAGASPRPGYVQQDMGAGHDLSTPQRYALCPPASGPHSGSFGPIDAGVYGPEDSGAAIPQGWVHNLEHGGLVVLYNVEADPEAGSEQRLDEYREFYSTFPDTPICGRPAGGRLGPVVARFDDMAWPYAALVWGRVLPLDSFDADQIREFYRSEGERTAPELPPNCVRPSPSPTAAPSPDASPGTSPAASPDASPTDAASPEPTAS